MRGIEFGNEFALDNYMTDTEAATLVLTSLDPSTTFEVEVIDGQPIKIIVESFAHATSEIKALATTTDSAVATFEGVIEAFAILGEADTGEMFGVVNFG